MHLAINQIRRTRAFALHLSLTPTIYIHIHIYMHKYICMYVLHIKTLESYARAKCVFGALHIHTYTHIYMYMYIPFRCCRELIVLLLCGIAKLAQYPTLVINNEMMCNTSNSLYIGGKASSTLSCKVDYFS